MNIKIIHLPTGQHGRVVQTHPLTQSHGNAVKAVVVLDTGEFRWFHLSEIREVKTSVNPIDPDDMI